MGWSDKYKKSINCDDPKGFSQRAHCQGRKKKMNEAKEKDHEVSMAQTQLKKSEENIRKLRKALGKKERNIPAWVQAKITDTEHNTDAASSYMDEGRRDGKSAKDPGYSLRDWFKGGGWVQAGGKYDGKPCAKQPGQTTKPFCRDADDRASMSKVERIRRAAKKRREDPNPNRKGKANIVREEIGIPIPPGKGGLKKVMEPLMKQHGGGKLIEPPPTKSANIKNAHFEPEGEMVEAFPNVKGTLNPWESPDTGKSGIKIIPGSKSGETKEMGPMKGGVFIKKAEKKIEKPLQVAHYNPEGEMVEQNGQPYKVGDTIPDSATKPKPKPTGAAKFKFSIDKTGLEGPKSPLPEEKDACYKKVKSRYDVWPSAYASGALVKCRKVGAANWGNKTKKEDYVYSNWRDDFKALEIESIDIIKPEPLQATDGIGSRMLEEAKKCWKGYKKTGTQKLFGKTYNRCVKEGNKSFGQFMEEMYQGAAPNLRNPHPALMKIPYIKDETPTQNMDRLKRTVKKSEYLDAKSNTNKPTQVAHFEPEGEIIEDWQKVNKSDKTDGMSPAAVKAYRRENPGSKLKTAVTGDPKPGSKDAKRRKSFCSRSKGQQDMYNIDCSKTPDKAICKARRRWKC